MMRNLFKPLWVLAAAAALAGCGGGSGSGGDDAASASAPPAPAADPLEVVPNAAIATPAATAAYLVTLSQNPSETRDPLEINAFDLPTSDTDEPAAL